MWLKRMNVIFCFDETVNNKNPDNHISSKAGNVNLADNVFLGHWML